MQKMYKIFGLLFVIILLAQNYSFAMEDSNNNLGNNIDTNYQDESFQNENYQDESFQNENYQDESFQNENYQNESFSELSPVEQTDNNEIDSEEPTIIINSQGMNIIMYPPTKKIKKK